MTPSEIWTRACEAMREAAAKGAEEWIGCSGLVDTWAAQCHDDAIRMAAQDIRALPHPPMPAEVAATRPYTCPVCKTTDPHGYLRCQYAGCLDGRDPR